MMMSTQKGPTHVQKVTEEGIKKGQGRSPVSETLIGDSSFSRYRFTLYRTRQGREGTSMRIICTITMGGSL
jgi:hypothetical protein